MAFFRRSRNNTAVASARAAIPSGDTEALTRQIETMAEKFIAGVDAQSALPELRELWDRNICFSVDLLGEACVSDTEAACYQTRYLDLIQTLPRQIAQWPRNERLESDHLGVV